MTSKLEQHKIEHIQLGISTSNIITGVGGAPLIASGHTITFNYDVNDFQLSGNNLQIKDSGIDHSGLGGLTGDDHTQYLLIDGTRSLTGYLDMDISTTPAVPTEGLRLFVEDVNGFPFFSFIDDSGMIRKIVRDSVFIGKNNTGVTIVANRAVYSTGNDSGTPTIGKARANDINTMPSIGVTLEDIADGEFGRIMQVGLVENVNTSAFAEGAVLYVSSTVAGLLVATAPLYPDIRQEVGVILVSDATVGTVQLIARSMFNEGILDHGGLLGLADDDHTQYALLLGRAGGQTLIGDTASGGDLTLQSTSHGTKGTIFFGAAGNSGYDEVNDILILGKTSSNGIQVDTIVPTFGWRDLLGEIRTRGVGATDPNDAAYIGNIKAYQFVVNDECWVDYHIPHDYVIGSDIYLHFHWSHNSAIVTGGTVTWGADVTYAKGHDQAAFIATVNPTVVGNASTTQYQHIITEVQISAATPGATQIDSGDLEPDGVIMIRAYLSANNITSGGAVPDPFLHFVDVHYQSTNIGTKDKVPDFYT
jgi:hypothetical protein